MRRTVPGLILVALVVAQGLLAASSDRSIWIGGDTDASVVIHLTDDQGEEWSYRGPRGGLGEAMPAGWKTRQVSCTLEYYCSRADASALLLVDDLKIADFELRFPPHDLKPDELFVDGHLPGEVGPKAFVSLDFSVDKDAVQVRMPRSMELLRVAAPGYAPNYIHIPSDTGSFSHPPVPLRAGGTISGWLVNAGDDDWVVEIAAPGSGYRTGTPLYGGSEVPTREGFFAFRDVAAGPYELFVRLRDSEVRLPVGQTEVAQGQEVLVGVIEVPEAIPFVDIVVTGRGLAGFDRWQVQLVRADQHALVYQTELEASGGATLSSVYPGTYRYLLITPTGSPFDSGEVVLDHGATIVELEVDALRVFGRVHDSGDEPVMASVRIGNGDGPTVSTRTDDEGRYETIIPYPERDLITAFVDPDGPAAGRGRTERDLVIEEAGVELDFEIHDLAVVARVVAMDTGDPVVGATVSLRRSKWGGEDLESDEAGEVRFEGLDEGEYVVSATQGDDRQSDDERVQVTEDAPEQDVLLILKELRSTALQVVGPTGAGIAEATVALNYQGARSSGVEEAYTNPSGWVDLELPADVERVSVIVFAPTAGMMFTQCVQFDAEGQARIALPPGPPGAFVLPPFAEDDPGTPALMAGITSSDGGLVTLGDLSAWTAMTGQEGDLIAYVRGGAWTVEGVAPGNYSFASPGSTNGCAAWPAGQWQTLLSGGRLELTTPE